MAIAGLTQGVCITLYVGSWLTIACALQWGAIAADASQACQGRAVAGLGATHALAD